MRVYKILGYGLVNPRLFVQVPLGRPLGSFMFSLIGLKRTLLSEALKGQPVLDQGYDSGVEDLKVRDCRNLGGSVPRI